MNLPKKSLTFVLYALENTYVFPMKSLKNLDLPIFADYIPIDEIRSVRKRIDSTL